MRCVLCLRRGEWPRRLQDVEELETAILHEREYRGAEGAAPTHERSVERPSP
jgi:hypothetical protein